MDQWKYIDSKLNSIMDSQRRLEDKVDVLLQTSATHAKEIEEHSESLLEHAKILYLGNGVNQPVNVRLANVEHRISNLVKQEEPTTKEKLTSWGKTATIIGIVINSIAQWYVGLGS
jgi:hypothetical protein